MQLDGVAREVADERVEDLVGHVRVQVGQLGLLQDQQRERFMAISITLGRFTDSITAMGGTSMTFVAAPATKLLARRAASCREWAFGVV